MTAAECADKAALFLAATIPILAVWRYGKLGIVIGALAVWIILGAVGPVLSALDPKRDAAILDSIWVLTGWLGGMIYASMIYVAVWLIRRFRNAVRDDKSVQSPESSE